MMTEEDSFTRSTENKDANLGPWRPIETAPTDKPVILRFRYQRGSYVRTRFAIGQHAQGNWHHAVAWEDGGATVECHPSDWMPIPDPLK